MGVLDTIKGAASSMAGNLPKAMLFVRKFNTGDDNEIEVEETSVNTKVSALRKLTTKKKKKSSSQKLMGQVAGAAGLGGDAAAEEAKATRKEIAQALTELDYVAMEVQFNPNRLNLVTSGGTQSEFKALGDSARRQLNTVDLPSVTTLSLQLVFDQVNIQDAFVREGNVLTNPTVGNIVSTVQSISTNAKGGYSVQTQTEGLLSLLVFRQTRDIIFYWNEMFFHGVLEYVNAKYTMFNKLGNPIRSVVDLTIRQADTDDTFKSDKEYWDAAFDAAFGEAGFNVTTQSRSKMERTLGGWF